MGSCPWLRIISLNLSGYVTVSQLSQVFRVVFGPSPMGSSPTFAAHRSRFSRQTSEVGSCFVLKNRGNTSLPRSVSRMYRSFSLTFHFRTALAGMYTKLPSNQSGWSCILCPSTYLQPMRSMASRWTTFASLTLAPSLSASHSSALKVLMEDGSLPLISFLVAMIE